MKCLFCGNEADTSSADWSEEKALQGIKEKWLAVPDAERFEDCDDCWSVLVRVTAHHDTDGVRYWLQDPDGGRWF